MKKWKPIYFEQCPFCGNDLSVLTEADAGECFDGDPVRCAECGFESGMSVDEYGNAWIQDV